jgi:hypothetical protein
VKRRLFWLVALAGVILLYLRRGGRRPEPVQSVPPAGAQPADPAEELRRKLEETKERETGVSHLSEPEPPHADPADPSAPAVSEELDARRREVHERARSAADEMRGTSSD